MNKKFLSVLLSLAFVATSATMLSGCDILASLGGGTSSQESSSETNSQSESMSDSQSEEESASSIDDAAIFGTEESEGLAYTLSKDQSHYLVSGLGECKDTKIVIPATYNGRPVLGVAEGNSQAGAGAFEGCQTLESIVLPEGATTIGAAAFASCRNLLRVSVPDSITMIEETAFKGCSSLIYNEYENAKYIGSTENPYAVLMSAKSTAIEDCSIHEDAVMIMGKAFNKCKNLKSVTFETAKQWTTNSEELAESDLKNTATAATYLTDTYVAKAWLRK